MGWKTIFISSKSKLSYKANHLLIQTATEVKTIPFHQIGCIMISTTQTVITSYLIAKLMEQDIKVIFCDNEHDPCSELTPYYSNLKRNQNIEKQISWSISKKEQLWTEIVTNKIENQIKIMKIFNLNTSEVVEELNQLEENDHSNREAIIAMKYFPAIFGNNFTRGNHDELTNVMLNYGYTVLLSTINQEIASQGYLTQLGIHHHSLQNDFNLSSDLMEPFRQFFDLEVLKIRDEEFNLDNKLRLIDVLNHEIKYDGKSYLIRNAITKHIQYCFKFMDSKKDNFVKVGIPDEV